MAFYNPKYINDFLEKKDDPEFKKLRGPDEYAYRAGIYRCEACGYEIAHPGRSHLPTRKSPQHSHEGFYEGKPIKWRLIVSTNYPHCEVEVPKIQLE